MPSSNSISNNPNSMPNEMRRDIEEAMQANWALFLTQGVIMIILGVFAVIWPQISTVAVDFYIGWMFLISGIAGLAVMFLAPSVSAFLWSLLTAALSLVVGILLLWHPVEGTVSLTLVLIAFFIAEGLFQVAAAIKYRDAFHDSWGWMAMSGVTDLILAWLMISGWPGTAIWALGLIVGVNLISSGVATTMAALAGRSLTKGGTRATR